MKHLNRNSQGHNGPKSSVTSPQDGPVCVFVSDCKIIDVRAHVHDCSLCLVFSGVDTLCLDVVLES